MRDGAVAGFKYFQFNGPVEMELEVRGTAQGVMQVSHTPDFVQAAEIPVHCGGSTGRFTGQVDVEAGKKALYFRFRGTGALDFLAFTMRNI